MDNVCKLYLFRISTSTRAIILFTAVCLISVFFENIVIDSVFADRNNFLNIYLVKWSWGWTFLAVGCYMLTRGFLHNNEESHHFIFTTLFQLAIGTAVWYTFASNVFGFVEHSTGICQASHLTSKRECRHSGFKWLAFDISGHSFLLLWNVLFTLENVKLPRNQQNSVSKNEDNSGVSVGNQNILDIQLFIISMLTFIWEVMLISTAFHFHTTGEKIVGSSISLLVWYLIYRVAGQGSKVSKLHDSGKIKIK